MTESLVIIDHFQGLEGETFSVALGEDSLDLVLVEVADDSDRLGRHNLEYLPRIPFTLILRGPLEPVLPQGIYRLSHPQRETIEQLMVPIVDLRKDGIYYQIIYN
ncbi:MAG: hypothetical protein C0631_06845 [Sedimenticola sp.]|nr:MAG: hypothetical protein C0631_06845 [Sedimenticola sp.]